ncbi:hypothetical protein RJT34_13285 [Clitoria ternatea]|uniref:Uncharacterized protein n=1 Tax=Clitoria ternatea TaxID=43366 RepID=A0AAN9JNN4_CLITE
MQLNLGKKKRARNGVVSETSPPRFYSLLFAFLILPPSETLSILSPSQSNTTSSPWSFFYQRRGPQISLLSNTFGGLKPV